MRRALAVIVAVGLIAVAGCGGGGGAGTQGQAGSERFAGIAVSGPKPAPPLALRNYRGGQINLKQYRGKAVLVTFIYTHCPDVCPLIVSHLRTTQAQLGSAARKLQIVAVSTDPRGDTPRTVAAFVKAHGMTGRMKYLIGSRRELERVWGAWNIVAKPEGGHGLVGHSALVYGIGADGRIRTLYSANFRPLELVHDVPLLEAQ